MRNEHNREKIAALVHDSWARWMQHLFSRSIKNQDGSVTIPPELVVRWETQIDTPYKALTETEKNSDRKEADVYVAALTQYHRNSGKHAV